MPVVATGTPFIISRAVFLSIERQVTVHARPAGSGCPAGSGGHRTAPPGAAPGRAAGRWTPAHSRGRPAWRRAGCEMRGSQLLHRFWLAAGGLDVERCRAARVIAGRVQRHRFLQLLTRALETAEVGLQLVAVGSTPACWATAGRRHLPGLSLSSWPRISAIAGRRVVGADSALQEAALHQVGGGGYLGPARTRCSAWP